MWRTIVRGIGGGGGGAWWRIKGRLAFDATIHETIAVIGEIVIIVYQTAALWPSCVDACVLQLRTIWPRQRSLSPSASCRKLLTVAQLLASLIELSCLFPPMPTAFPSDWMISLPNASRNQIMVLMAVLSGLIFSMHHIIPLQNFDRCGDDELSWARYLDASDACCAKFLALRR